MVKTVSECPLNNVAWREEDPAAALQNLQATPFFIPTRYHNFLAASEEKQLQSLNHASHKTRPLVHDATVAEEDKRLQQIKNKLKLLLKVAILANMRQRNNVFMWGNIWVHEWMQRKQLEKQLKKVF